MITRMKKLGCSESVVGLVIPTGYSFNLDAFLIYLTLATVFIVQATNTPFAFMDLLLILGVALLTSKGAHGIPADDAYSVMVRARAEGNPGTELQALAGRFDLSSRLTGDLVDVFRKHRPSLWLSHDVSATLHLAR